MIKYLKDYDKNGKAKQCSMAIRRSKQNITIVIDTLGNKYVTVLNDLKYFVNMKQGQNESDNSLLKREKYTIKTLCFDGVTHVLYSAQLSDDISPSTPTDIEWKTEVEFFFAVYLLTTKNPHRYKELNDELINTF